MSKHTPGPWDIEAQPPTKDYPFATLKTEIELTVKEKVWTAVVAALALGMIALMGIGAVTVWRWL